MSDATLPTATRVRAQAPSNFQPEWKMACEAICARQGLTLARAKEKYRFRAYVTARRECYEFLRARGWSTTQVGVLFHRDASTIVQARRLLEKREAAALRASF